MHAALITYDDLTTKEIDDYLETSEEALTLFENFISFLEQAPLTALRTKKSLEAIKNHGLHGTDTSQSTRNDSLDYDEIVVTCFQHFPNITLKEIERMTPYEFNLRIKAVNLRAINEERKLYVNALATRILQHQMKKGNAIFLTK